MARAALLSQSPWPSNTTTARGGRSVVLNAWCVAVPVASGCMPAVCPRCHARTLRSSGPPVGSFSNGSRRPGGAGAAGLGGARHQSGRCGARPVLSVGPQVGVGVQGDARLRVPQGVLDRDHVTPGVDQARGEEVAQVVEAESPEARRVPRAAPAVSDGVLMRRLAVLAREEVGGGLAADLPRGDVSGRRSTSAARGGPCAGCPASACAPRPAPRRGAGPAARRGGCAA